MSLPWGAGIWGSDTWGGYSLDAYGSGSPATVTGNACEFLIDPATDDLALPIRLVRGPLAIAQRIRSRLLFFSGEWFLDTRLGMPYFDQILIKNPRLPVVSAIFRKAVRTTPGVVSCSPPKVTGGSAIDRVGSVSFEALLDDGAILTAVDAPFIVRERSVA